MIKIMLALVLTAGTAEASPYLFPAPDLPELHIYKNDGMNTHHKYICVNYVKCMSMLTALRYKDPTVSCANMIFIKQGGRFWKIK